LEPIEVKPGKVKIVLKAEGYFPEEREVFAREKQMTAIDVQLRPMPAKVEIKGRAGSTITIDGIPRGILPISTPIEVEAGPRVIAVSQNGFNTFAQEYNLGRAQVTSIKADLSRTRQRIASGIMFGAGITFGTLGVLTTLNAVEEFGKAAAIGVPYADKKNPATITFEKLEDYNEHRENQSNATIATTVLYNLALGSAALGFLLYYFDEPKLPQVKPKKDDPAPKKDSTPGLQDMMFTPVMGPGYGGVGFSAKF
jgi:PEGA domain